jgi:peptide/nickel transport system permease protein
MVAYVIRRLLWAIVLLTIISFVTFVIFLKLPTADPAILRAGRNPTPEIVAAIRDQFGLDQPWYVQYWKYVHGIVLHLDFGFSYQNNTSVRGEIFSRLPVTAGLVIGGMLVWLLVGIPIGIVSALRRGRASDRLLMGGALLMISAPVYWLGLVALYLFSKDVGLLPIFDGAGTYPLGGQTLFSDPLAVVPTLLLPWIVLAASFAAIYARFVRASLVEVMSDDFIRTARAKGLRERRVVLKHGMRATAAPIVTLLGLDLGILLGGAILVETVFNIPGIGRLSYDAIQRGDLPVVQGVVIVGAAIIILLNLLVDLAYAALDPRVRSATR